MYFYLMPSEDGFHMYWYEDRAAMEKELNTDIEWREGRYLPEYYGSTTELPDSDPNYWDKNLIIKGEIVVPKTVEVITQLEID